VVTLPNQEKKRLFVKELEQLHYTIQGEHYVPYEARLHTLLEGVKAEDVTNEFRRKFSEEPLGVELIPYRETNAKHRGLHFAVIRCNSALYKKFQDARGMNMWWQWCCIDATPRAIKCLKCGMLGHTQKYCDKEWEVRTIQEDPTWKGCIDCYMQNTINDKRRGYRRRDINHKSNTDQCPTYKSLAKRRLRLWCKSEASVQETEIMQNGLAGTSQQNADGGKDPNMEIS